MAKLDRPRRPGAAAKRPRADRDRLARRDRRACSSSGLKWSLKHAYDNVAHYKRRLRPGRRASRRSQARSPICASFRSPPKTTCATNYPFGMFAVPREQVARIHASSGTTGKPTVVGYTARDIDIWADVMRALDARERLPARHAGAHRLRLRAVHRRARRALRRRAARLHGGAGLRRHDRAAGQADRRFQARRHHGHAELYACDPR